MSEPTVPRRPTTGNIRAVTGSGRAVTGSGPAVRATGSTRAVTGTQRAVTGSDAAIRATGSVPRVTGTGPAVGDRRDGPRIWLLVTAVAMLGIFAIQVLPDPAPVVPTELFGVWTTDDSAYQGRRLIIDASQVTQVTGMAPDERFPIEGVRTARRGDTLAVTLAFGGGELSMGWVRDPVEQLILAHPVGVVWRRRGARAPGTPASPGGA